MQTAEPYLALFDSGAKDNFILRSVALERRLDIYPLPGKGITVKLPGGKEIQASEYVRPDWSILLIGRNRHRKFLFIVLDQLPNNLEIVIGVYASRELGIGHFYTDPSLLVIHVDEGAG